MATFGPDTGRVDPSRVVEQDDRLLAAIGDRAEEIGPVVTHWPHVASNYRGLAFIGQAVHAYTQVIVDAVRRAEVSAETWGAKPKGRGPRPASISRAAGRGPRQAAA